MAILRYPPDLTEDSRRLPYMKLQMVKFRERNFVWDNQRKKFANTPPVKERLNTVVLPLPENVTNAYNLNWEMANLQGIKFIEGLLQEESLARGLVSENTARNAAAIIFDNISKIATQQTPNPKKQALFNGIDPRTFSFTFTFSPQSLREAEQLERVIRELTVNALPSLTSEAQGPTLDGTPLGEVDDPNSAFFKFPSEFEISFFNVAGFPRLSTCVCTNISTNYSPTTMQLLDSGHTVQTSLTLTFLETELLRKTKPGI